MMEKYKPCGEPITEHEREVLINLIEECGEVIQAATKILRFGKEHHPGKARPNTEHLGLELGDLQVLMNMTVTSGIVRGEDAIAGSRRKRERLSRFMLTE